MFADRVLEQKPYIIVRPYLSPVAMADAALVGPRRAEQDLNHDVCVW